MTDYLHIQLPPDQIRGISSIGLAHMGDAVYDHEEETGKVASRM